MYTEAAMMTIVMSDWVNSEELNDYNGHRNIAVGRFAYKKEDTKLQLIEEPKIQMNQVMKMRITIGAERFQ